MMETKEMFWYNISTCPVCGKKLKSTNDIIAPHVYLCSDCYWKNAPYHKKVDEESNLEYHKQNL